MSLGRTNTNMSINPNEETIKSSYSIAWVIEEEEEDDLDDDDDIV